jgi:hypothetical protein
MSTNKTQHLDVNKQTQHLDVNKQNAMFRDQQTKHNV